MKHNKITMPDLYLKLSDFESFGNIGKTITDDHVII